MMNALRLIDGFPARLFQERTRLPLSTVQRELDDAERRGLLSANARTHRADFARPAVFERSAAVVPARGIAAARLRRSMQASNAGITADSQVARIFEWRRGFNTIHLIDLGIKVRTRQGAGGDAGRDVRQSLPAHWVCMRPMSTPGARPPTAWKSWMRTSGGAGAWPRTSTVILANAGHPRYLGGYVRLGTEVAADDFARTGGSVCGRATTKPFQGRGEGFAQAIAESTWGLQVVTAKKILPELPQLAPQLEAGGAILEVGCGTGNLLLQLAKTFPKARCIGVDIDADSLSARAGQDRESGLSAIACRRAPRERGLSQPIRTRSCVPSWSRCCTRLRRACVPPSSTRRAQRSSPAAGW